MADGQTWGDRIRSLERYANSIGKTQKELAGELGVSPKTLRSWKTRRDRPSQGPAGPGGKAYERITRRERYRENERPTRLKPARETPETIDVDAVPRGVEVIPGDLLDGDGPSGFRFTPSAPGPVRDAILDGRRLTFYLALQDPEDLLAPREIVPVTFETAGMDPIEVQRSYYRAIRRALGERSSDYDVVLAGAVPA